MNWINLRTELLRSSEFANAKSGAIETWLRVLAYSCEQENGGKIAGAAKWTERAWLTTCGVTKSEVENAAPLLYDDGIDIFVSGYPNEKEAEVQAKRKAGKKGGKQRAKNSALQHATSNGSSCASNIASTEGEGEWKENGNGKENGNLHPTKAPAARGVVEGRQSDRVPSTEQSKRIATLFHRRHTTAWSDKEVEAYRKIGLVEGDDLSAIERYYAAERAKGEGESGGKHRRDLATFLNNFTGELDRARAHKPFKGVSKPLQIDEAQWRRFLTGLNRSYEEPSRAMPYLREEFAKWLKLEP